VYVDGQLVRLETHRTVTDAWRLTGWSIGAGVDLGEFTVSPPTLEEAYLALTSEAGDDR
jgi:ABC-2 type transport system ATP-binding protein